MPCSEHSEFDSSCVMCWKADNNSLREENKAFKQENEVFKQESPTFAEICRGNSLLTYNTSTSSGHVYTNHEPAEVDYCDTIPTVQLRETFWNHRPKLYLKHKEMDSETQSNSFLANLMTAVVFALGLENHVRVTNDVSMMGTAPDVGLLAISNRLLIGTMEGKKDPKKLQSAENAWLWGSNTPVAGEVFEQLYLSSGQIRASAFGMLTTGKAWQLTCIDSFSEEHVIDSAKILADLGPAPDEGNDVSPLKPKLISPPEDVQRDLTEETQGDPTDFSVITFPVPGKANPTPAVAMPKKFPPNMEVKKQQHPKKPTRKKEEKTEKKGKRPAPTKEDTTKKRGKVTELASEQQFKRKYYASNILRLGNENQNRKVVELMAIFVLASVENWRKAKQLPQGLESNKWYPCRTVTKKGVEQVSAIKLPHGLDWKSYTQVTECNEFHAICQLGYGDTGACCFAVTNKGTPAVIKFYRLKDVELSKRAAEAEYEAWQKINGDMEVQLINLADGKFALVMQFIFGVHDEGERNRLIDGGHNSLLFEALLKFASSGKKHQDLKWHHVGTFRKGCPDESVRLYDLESVEDLDGVSAEEWARTAFNELRGRPIETATSSWQQVLHNDGAAVQSSGDPNMYSGNSDKQNHSNKVGVAHAQNSSNMYDLLDAYDSDED